MAKLLLNVQAMEVGMAAAIRKASEGQTEQRLRAEKAEKEVKRLIEQLRATTHTRGNAGPVSTMDSDVIMHPSGSWKGKERQPKEEEEYDAGDETDPNEEVMSCSLTHLFSLTRVFTDRSYSTWTCASS